MNKENNLLKRTEIVMSDVDGIWTDAGMYYSKNGDELKKFSAYDGGAVLFLKIAKIPLVILSGEKNAILVNRFRKLNIDDVRLGIKNKELELKNVLKKYNITVENALYIGDFINDYPIMKKVGIPVCPKNACDEIKEISKLVIEKSGGDGVLWELSKQILKAKGLYQTVFPQFLESLKMK
ncbi:MAG: KdsC family phosphatase [Candidatus Thorarchaeota archaeon]